MNALQQDIVENLSRFSQISINVLWKNIDQCLQCQLNVVTSGKSENA